MFEAGEKERALLAVRDDHDERTVTI